MLTWPGKICFSPFTWPPRSSLEPAQPYSLCMSKIRLTATRCWITPASSSRLRNVLPVPDLPKTPLDRSTSRSRFSVILTFSMSSGAPMWK